MSDFSPIDILLEASDVSIDDESIKSLLKRLSLWDLSELKEAIRTWINSNPTSGDEVAAKKGAKRIMELFKRESKNFARNEYESITGKMMDPDSWSWRSYYITSKPFWALQLVNFLISFGICRKSGIKSILTFISGTLVAALVTALYYNTKRTTITKTIVQLSSILKRIADYKYYIFEKNVAVTNPVFDFGYKVTDILLDISASIITRDVMTLTEVRDSLDPDDSGDHQVMMMTNSKAGQAKNTETFNFITKEQLTALEKSLAGINVNFGLGSAVRSSLTGIGEAASNLKGALKYNNFLLDMKLYFTNKKELVIFFSEYDKFLHSLNHIVDGLNNYLNMKILGSELTELSRMELSILVARLSTVRSGFVKIRDIMYSHYANLKPGDFGVTLLRRFHNLIDTFLESKNEFFEKLLIQAKNNKQAIVKTVDLTKVKKKEEKKDNKGNQNQNQNQKQNNNQNKKKQ